MRASQLRTFRLTKVPRVGFGALKFARSLAFTRSKRNKKKNYLPNLLLLKGQGDVAP